MKRQSSSVSATVIVASVDRRKRNLVNPEETVPRLITVADSVNDAPAAGFASLAMGAATVRSAPDDAGSGGPGSRGPGSAGRPASPDAATTTATDAKQLLPVSDSPLTASTHAP